jgi:hypothetical protein
MSHDGQIRVARVAALTWMVSLGGVGCVDKGDDLAPSVGEPDASVVLPPTGIAALPRSTQTAVCTRLVDTIKQVVVPFARSECTELVRADPSLACAEARDTCVPGKQENYNEVWQGFDCVNTPESVTSTCGIAVEEFDACLDALKAAYAELELRVTCANSEPSSPPHPQVCLDLGERCPDLAEFGL